MTATPSKPVSEAVARFLAARPLLMAFVAIAAADGTRIVLLRLMA